MKLVFKVLAGTVLAFVMTGCSGSDTSTPAQQSGSASTAATVQLLDAAASVLFIAENSPTIIDVRTQEEFEAGYIAGATLIDISSPGFTDAISTLDRSATYFVYCRSGNRSATATSAMIDLGFTKVYELDGGIVAWSAAGNAIQS